MTSLQPTTPGSELILGGQKSGKSRRAETLASGWLASAPQRRAVLIATALPYDDEMRQRISRHQSDRAERVPGLHTVEEPLDLAGALKQHSQPHTLVVIDCLTLWLTNWRMPMRSEVELLDPEAQRSVAPAPELALVEAIRSAPGPVVLVSNEISLGVIPMGSEVRAFLDALGLLHQQVGAVCERVTLMVAGLPLAVKGAP